MFNGLSLNSILTKSEVLLGTAAKLWTLEAVGRVSVAGAIINLTDSIKNLGVFLDPERIFDIHVSHVCQSSYFHIKALRRLRGSLCPEVANAVACANVGARLDYCNSKLYVTSTNNISRLQRVQDTLARVLTGRRNSIISSQFSNGYTGFPSAIRKSKKEQ